MKPFSGTASRGLPMAMTVIHERASNRESTEVGKGAYPSRRLPTKLDPFPHQLLSVLEKRHKLSRTQNPPRVAQRKAEGLTGMRTLSLVVSCRCWVDASGAAGFLEAIGWDLASRLRWSRDSRDTGTSSSLHSSIAALYSSIEDMLAASIDLPIRADVIPIPRPYATSPRVERCILHIACWSAGCGCPPAQEASLKPARSLDDHVFQVAYRISPPVLWPSSRHCRSASR